MKTRALALVSVLLFLLAGFCACQKALEPWQTKRLEEIRSDSMQHYGLPGYGYFRLPGSWEIAEVSTAGTPSMSLESLSYSFYIHLSVSPFDRTLEEEVEFWHQLGLDTGHRDTVKPVPQKLNGRQAVFFQQTYDQVYGQAVWVFEGLEGRLYIIKLSVSEWLMDEGVNLVNSGYTLTEVGVPLDEVIHATLPVPEGAEEPSGLAKFEGPFVRVGDPKIGTLLLPKEWAVTPSFEEGVMSIFYNGDSLLVQSEPIGTTGDREHLEELFLEMHQNEPFFSTKETRIDGAPAFFYRYRFSYEKDAQALLEWVVFTEEARWSMRVLTHDPEAWIKQIENTFEFGSHPAKN